MSLAVSSCTKWKHRSKTHCKQ